MALIVRRQLQKCELLTSDTGVPIEQLMRNAEMNTCVFTTPTEQAGTRFLGSRGCSTRCLCAIAWADPTTSGHTAGPAKLGGALSDQTEAKPGSAISEALMLSQELMRNAKASSTFTRGAA